MLSVAMKAFHEQPTSSAHPDAAPDGVTPSEMTVSMETPTWDELSRLWQGAGLSLRMTAQYRVSVALLTPRPGAVGAAGTRRPGCPRRDRLPTGTGRTRTCTARSAASVSRARGGRRKRSTTRPRRARRRRPNGLHGPDLRPTRGSGIQDTDQVFLVTTAPNGIETEQDVTPAGRCRSSPRTPRRRRRGALTCSAAGRGDPAGRYQLVVTRPSASRAGARTRCRSRIAPWLDPTSGPLLRRGRRRLHVPGPERAGLAGAELRLGSVVLDAEPPAPRRTAGEWRQRGLR